MKKVKESRKERNGVEKKSVRKKNIKYLKKKAVTKILQR